MFGWRRLKCPLLGLLLTFVLIGFWLSTSEVIVVECPDHHCPGWSFVSNKKAPRRSLVQSPPRPPDHPTSLSFNRRSPQLQPHPPNHSTPLLFNQKRLSIQPRPPNHPTLLPSNRRRSPNTQFLLYPPNHPTPVPSNQSTAKSHGRRPAPPAKLRGKRPAYPQPLHQSPPLPTHFKNLTHEQIKTVEKFIFFVGYGRSGHSIVASIMDAHPNVIIAHEYYLFDRLIDSPQLWTKRNLFDELYWNSYNSARKGWRAAVKTSKGYNLNLNGTWQGQFQTLKVIGDKTGGSTAMIYHKSPTLFKNILIMLHSVTKVPYHAIHVVRNPYDMISTVALYQATNDPKYHRVNASVANKFRDMAYLSLASNIVLSKAAAVDAMTSDCKLSVLEVHLEDLISEPRTIVYHICAFLELPCTDEYVNACVQKVYHRASRSRDLVYWPEWYRRKVDNAIRQFKFFQRYSFDGA